MVHQLTKTHVKALDDHRYVETFTAFLSYCSQSQVAVNRLDRAASSLPPNFSCLDIGAGSGEIIQDWVNRGNHPDRYVAVEPNQDHFEMLTKTLSNLHLNGRSLHQKASKDFYIPESFDMVLFFLSFYFMEDPVMCVDNILKKMMNPKGVGVIFMQGPYSFYNLCRVFEPLLDREKPAGPNHLISSYDIQIGLRALGYRTKVFMDPSAIDITDASDFDLEEILSFMIQGEVSEIQGPLREDLVQHIKGACIQDMSGRKLFYDPNVVILVEKKIDEE